MILNILAVAEIQMRKSTSFSTLILIFVGVPILSLLIIGLIRLVRYLGNAGKEQKLTRMELGKVAEEVHQLRQELKGIKNSDSSEQ